MKLDDRIVGEARKLDRHRTGKKAVTAALVESIQRRKRQEILTLFGTIEYDESYDHKLERRSKHS